MKRYVACFLGSILAALLAVGPTFAVEYNVSAKGKNEQIAATNAGVNAVRTCMKELVTKEFLQANAEAVRLNIILKSNEFVTACTILESKPHGAFISVQAVIDVDKDRLKNTLDALHPGTSSSEAGKAVPATPAAAPAANPMGLADKSAPTDDAVPALPPTTAPEPVSPDMAEKASPSPVAKTMEKALPTVNTTAQPLPAAAHKALSPERQPLPPPPAVSQPPRWRIECYVAHSQKNIGQYLSRLLRILPHSVLPHKDRAFVELIAQVDVHDLRLLVSKFDKHFEYDIAFVISFSLKDKTEALKRLVNSELTIREFSALLGIDAKKIPAGLGANLDDILFVSPHERYTKDRDIRFMDIYLFGPAGRPMAVLGDTLIFSDHPEMLLEAKEEFMTKGKLFNVPNNEQVWGRCVLPFRTAKDGKEVTVPYERVFSMKAIPEGLTWSTTLISGQTPPLSTSRPQLPLVDTAVYGTVQPSVLITGRGDLLQAMLPLRPQMQKEVKKIAAAVDTISFGIGAAKSSIMGISIPVCPYLYLTGDEKVLAEITQNLKSIFLGKWEKVVVKGWPTVEVNKKCRVGGDDNAPLHPLILAYKEGTIVLAMTDSAEFLKTMQPAGKIVGSVTQAYAPSIQCPLEKAESIAVLDVKRLWQETVQLVGPGSILHRAIEQKADAKAMAAFNRLCSLVPPVLAIVGWVNAAGTSQGYILMDKADSTEFVDTLVKFICTFDKK